MYTQHTKHTRHDTVHNVWGIGRIIDRLISALIASTMIQRKLIYYFRSHQDMEMWKVSDEIFAFD